MSKYLNFAILFSIVMVLTISSLTYASEITNLAAQDVPSDSGNAVVLSWDRLDREDGSSWFVVEAAAKKEGPYRKVKRVLTGTTWYGDLPNIFGHPENPALRHAIKVTIAPPPESSVEEMREKANLELAATREKVDALTADIAERKVAFDAFVAERIRLEKALAALSKDLKNKDNSKDRLYAYHRVEAYKEANRHFVRQHDQLRALKEKIERLEAWSPPEESTLVTGHLYHFRVSLEQDGMLAASATASAIPESNWFNFNRLNNLVIALVLAFLILYYTWRAARNPEDIFVRRIAGLEAVDEAIGRATEMGKPIFFVHGLATISTISTVAAINILGKIAEKVAEYGTAFKVTNRDPIVLAVSQETVKESYLRAGRPDLYNEDDVFYVSQDQFSYATGVEGMLLREKPASNFFFGYYYAEALLLTETGAHIGSIQIAGTDSYTQLPFFITTCDYTLMGEELYAASAYMSRNPKLLASLKAQDLTKGILLLLSIIGVILSSAGLMWFSYMTESF